MTQSLGVWALAALGLAFSGCGGASLSDEEFSSPGLQAHARSEAQTYDDLRPVVDDSEEVISEESEPLEPESEPEVAPLPEEPTEIETPPKKLRPPSTRPVQKPVTAPQVRTSPVPQVVGSVSKGSLRNASALPWSTSALKKLHEKRNRRFGSYELVDLLLKASTTLKSLFPFGERLQVADLSDSNGGLLPPHKSHRTGRDADVLYLRKDHRELGTNELLDRNDPKDWMIERTRKGVLQIADNFDVERNWALMKILARSGNVRYIFVHGVIKEEFCDYAKNIGEFESEEETLRLVRKIKGHTGHFHLRIKCPKLSFGCKDQGAPPRGTGCGSGTYEEEDFDWSDMLHLEDHEEDAI